MTKYFSFNKIIVIESLLEDDLKTGRQLYADYLRWMEEKVDELQTAFVPVNSKKELMQRLDEIALETQQLKIFPFIHFEVHGSITGLRLNSDEQVTWSELVEYLRAINIITKNNLVVSFATCFGARVLSSIFPSEKAPFWGVVAPWEEVTTEDVVSFFDFFEELITRLDLNEAIDLLNDKRQRFLFFNSEELFENVWKVYEEKAYQKDGFERRIEELVASTHSLENVKLSEEERRNYFVEKLLSGRTEIRLKWRERFLMVAEASDQDQ